MGVATRFARSVGRAVAVIFGLPFLLIGLVVAGGALLSLVNAAGPAMATVTVDQTTGTMTTAEVQSETVGGETVYYPRVEYSYTVDGETYTGEHLLPPGERDAGGTEYMEFDTREAAEAELTSYGGSPTVYYRGDPGTAYLDGPRVALGNIGGAIVGILFGVPFLLVGFYTVKWGFTDHDESEAVGGVKEAAAEAMEEAAEREAQREGGSDEEWGSADFDGESGGVFGGGGDGGGGFGGDGGGGGE
jgi:hypothetical protein